MTNEEAKLILRAAIDFIENEDLKELAKSALKQLDSGEASPPPRPPRPGGSWVMRYAIGE